MAANTFNDRDFLHKKKKTNLEKANILSKFKHTIQRTKNQITHIYVGQPVLIDFQPRYKNEAERIKAQEKNRKREIENITFLRTKNLKTGCLIWLGSFRKDGTPIRKRRGQQTNVRTLLFKLQSHETLVKVKSVFNTCGNRKCISPDHSSVHRPGKPISQKLSKFKITEAGCHIFPTQKRTDQYAKITHKGKTLNAAREAYKLAKGPIPDGFEITHICNHKQCFNPIHLLAEGKSSGRSQGGSQQWIQKQTA